MEADRYSLGSLSNFLDVAMSRYYGHGQSAQGAQEAAGPNNETPAEIDGAYATTSELDAAWERAKRVFQEGTQVSGIVAGWNRGGLLVRWDKLQGFVPTSQLKDIPIFTDDESRDEKLARWVGEELSLRVIELDRSRNRLVFSERATAWGPKDGERLLNEITPGETRSGFVSNLCDFGAFVDLGGVDGLIHISELSWGRVIHPREMLEIGQQVQVYVISVDRDSRRIALSLKRLRPNPWATVDQRFHVGQVTQATVTNVVDFGAFAQIEEGLEGLVHVSELSDDPISHPSEVIHVGDQVLVQILRIDSANHRLALSIKRAANATSTDPKEDFDQGEAT
ncbi:MAG: S1 RNA-binding domain-containing protein, partial [Chloroflexi bacterium]|nr:S1 RNA-binding domain-containing protein [Chloroflexota bacterium]